MLGLKGVLQIQLMISSDADFLLLFLAEEMNSHPSALIAAHRFFSVLKFEGNHRR